MTNVERLIKCRDDANSLLAEMQRLPENTTVQSAMAHVTQAAAELDEFEKVIRYMAGDTRRQDEP